MHTRRSTRSAAALLLTAGIAGLMAVAAGLARAPALLSRRSDCARSGNAERQRRARSRRQRAVRLRRELVPRRRRQDEQSRRQHRTRSTRCPDSSWFTNRLGRDADGRPTELVKGPDTGTGPVGDVDDRLGQDGGTRAGLHHSRPGRPDLLHQVRSAGEPGDGDRRRGDLRPSSSTRSAITSPRTTSRRCRREALDHRRRRARSNDKRGRRRRCSSATSTSCSKRAAQQRATARYRAVASKALDGKPVGPFRYYGTRPDDPNDIFPHEHRRELRGLLVVLRLAEPRRLAQHQQPRHARDATAAARSSAITCSTSDRRSAAARTQAQSTRAGNEFLWESRPTFITMLTLGFYVRPWIKVPYPDIPALGRIEVRLLPARGLEARIPQRGVLERAARGSLLGRPHPRRAVRRRRPRRGRRRRGSPIRKATRVPDRDAAAAQAARCSTSWLNGDEPGRRPGARARPAS